MLQEKTLPLHVKAEMRARDAGASSYDSHLSGRFYTEVTPTLNEIGNLSGKRVIEHGAGTGRFTQVLSKTSDLYLASDISVESLRVLSGKDIPPNVGLICADATSLRVREAFFHIALALQVIEHMPTPDIRATFYLNVSTSLKLGGSFIASVYHQDMRRTLKGEPVDGIHENKIPFHFFSVSEFSSELRRHFSRVSSRPIDITLPLEKRLRLPQSIEGLISRMCEYIPILNMYGHLVLAKAVK